MGSCCSRARANDCMVCKCHLPLSEALNGTTYQWSGIRYQTQLKKLDMGLMNHVNGGYGGNWQQMEPFSMHDITTYISKNCSVNINDIPDKTSKL